MLVVLLAAVAWAQPDPCVQKAGAAVIEPATLDALRDCQQKSMAAWQKAHPGVTDDSFNQADESQRAEARDYVARHAKTGPVQPPATSTPTPAGLDAFKSKLNAESNQGKDGVTPQMARDIADYLYKEQGGVSPEMQALLDALQRDGPNLSDDSALRLKKAARQAKSAGLDLGVDPQMEKWLLDPSTDPTLPPRTPRSSATPSRRTTSSTWAITR